MKRNDNFRKVRGFSGLKPFIDGFFRAIRITLTSITLLTAMVVSVVTMLVWVHLSKVPNLSVLENYNPGASIELYDSKNKQICKFPPKEKRQVITLNQVSPYMINAVLAAEDHSFYQHKGISPVGILRAAVANISAGRAVQGGSTLTQQLVKNLFYEKSSRTIPLKVAEGIVAQEIERKYSKEKILEIYLNQIYFGNGAYGIEQAANIYFAKKAIELNISEAAFLAGIIKSPSYLGDKKHLNKALARQKIIIAKMQEYKFISQLEGIEAEREYLNFKRANPIKKPKKQNQFVPPHPYFSQYVADQLSNDYNYNHQKSLRVFTTLDTKAQASAEATMRHAKATLPKKLDQAALVAIRISDGAIIALVGGLGNYLDHQWNSAVHSHTMGSCFKPFVYLSAFEHGVISPSSQLYDSPLSVLDDGDTIWQPKNFDHRYLGYMTAEDALAHSRNICSVRVAQQIGINTVIDTARRAGIKEELAPTLALSLGSSAASPLSMANAYATIARGGMYIKPRFIRRVENDRGKEIAKFEPISSRVLDLVASRQIVDILRKVVLSGTGTRARLSGIPVAGKTGTADDSKDLWFVGFTPDIVAAVWVGNSKNKKVGGRHTTGGRIVAPIWKRFVSSYYRNHQKPRTKLITNGGPSEGTSIKRENEVKQTISYPQRTNFRKRKSSSNRRSVRKGKTKQRPRQSGRGVKEYNWSR